MDKKFNQHYKIEDDVLFINVNTINFDRFHEGITGIINETKKTNIVFDFSDTTMMTSAMIGTLLYFFKSDMNFVIYRPTNSIYNKFKITKLTTVFPIFQNKELAIKHLLSQSQ